jgi:hypothetical protein
MRSNSISETRMRCSVGTESVPDPGFEKLPLFSPLQGGIEKKGAYPGPWGMSP